MADSTDVDFVITEIGGTVGDIESLPFLEAIRQFPVEVGRRRCMFIHLTLVPYIGHAGELKTKPTQHSVNELRRIGINPDMVHVPLRVGALDRDPQEDRAVREPAGRTRSSPPTTCRTSTACPLTFHEQGVDDFILKDHFGIDAPPPDLGSWKAIVDRAASLTDEVRIALVGKYVQLEDAYLSVAEALRHSGIHHGCRVKIEWVDSETVGEPEVDALLRRIDGILIPGGFGGRGFEGKIAAAKIARESGIPYLGVCLGMHVAVSEFARHVADMPGANSTEMDPETPFPVIDLLPEQREIADMGGTMRLGADPVKVHAGTRALRGIRRRRRLRASPPPLRGQQPPEEAARRPPAWCSRARRRTSAWSRSQSCRATCTRSTLPRSSTPSSSRVLTGPRRCSGSSSAPPTPTGADAPIVAPLVQSGEVTATRVLGRASDAGSRAPTRAPATARDLRGALPDPKSDRR